MLHLPGKRGTGRGNKIRYDIIPRIDNISVKWKWIKIVRVVDYPLKLVDRGNFPLSILIFCEIVEDQNG